jgi:hypothetical protein
MLKAICEFTGKNVLKSYHHANNKHNGEAMLAHVGLMPVGNSQIA